MSEQGQEERGAAGVGAVGRRRMRLDGALALAAGLVAALLLACLVVDGGLARAVRSAEADRVLAGQRLHANALQEQLALATADQLRLARFPWLARPGPESHAFDAAILRHEQAGSLFGRNRADERAHGERAGKRLDAAALRRDQLGLAEAALALALALLALAALTRRAALGWAAALPAAVGVAMSVVGFLALAWFPVV